jgi:phosphoribosylanthranilate isomerase
VFVKICGITHEQDALLAVAVGADALGFVFAPSPRQISPALAREIVKRLPAETVTVGVFRNETPSRIVEVVNEARLQGAQLHGHETPAMTAEVATNVRFVIKAVVAGSQDATNAKNFSADAILVDGLHPGSGTAYDWELLQDIPNDIRMMLSGGLTPENVVAGILQVRPWGVDVSSGVEKTPGQKDAVKMRHFITNARDAVLG